MKTTDIRISGAAALLQALSDHKIDHVFSNAGTDFAPIIEAIVAMNNDGVSCPHFVTVPHETVAVSMAHGHCIQSGKTSAAMVAYNGRHSERSDGSHQCRMRQYPVAALGRGARQYLKQDKTHRGRGIFIGDKRASIREG